LRSVLGSVLGCFKVPFWGSVLVIDFRADFEIVLGWVLGIVLGLVLNRPGDNLGVSSGNS